MARLYTPFFSKGASDIGGAMVGSAQREQLQGLTKSAYMGDPQAMAQLTAVNPQIANQIQQSKRQQQQDQLAQAGQQRQQSAQSEQLVQGVMKQAAQLGTFEEALAYTENAKAKYEAAGLIQPGQYEPLTEADFSQMQQIFGPKAAAPPSALDEARTAKLYAEIEKMGSGSDQDAADLLAIQERLQKMDERRVSMETKAEDRRVAAEEKAIKKEAQTAESIGAVATIDELMSPDFDLDSIYGKGEGIFPDFARSQKGIDMMAKRDQIVSLMELAAAGKMKGQGTISESERTTIRNSASLLKNEQLSPIEAMKELTKVRKIFAKNAGMEGDTGGGGEITTQSEYDALPSGATYMEGGVEYRKP